MNHIQTLKLARLYLSSVVGGIGDREQDRLAAMHRLIEDVTGHDISMATLERDDVISRFVRRIHDQEFTLMLISPTLHRLLEDGGEDALEVLVKYLSDKKFPLTLEEYREAYCRLPNTSYASNMVFDQGRWEREVHPYELLRYRAIAELASGLRMSDAYEKLTADAYHLIMALHGLSNGQFLALISNRRLTYRLSSAETFDQVCNDISIVRASL